MRSRSFIAVAVGFVLLFAVAGAMLAYDSSQRNKIADGIKIGGVDVGGLTAAKASARVNAAYVTRLQRAVVVDYRGHRWTLPARATRVRINAGEAVSDALARSRSDGFFTRVYRGV